MPSTSRPNAAAMEDDVHRNGTSPGRRNGEFVCTADVTVVSSEPDPPAGGREFVCALSACASVPAVFAPSVQSKIHRWKLSSVCAHRAKLSTTISKALSNRSEERRVGKE